MSKALDSMDRAIDNTARALASLGHHVGSKDAAPSKGFQILIRLIGEAKTKHEEDRIVKKESMFLKEKIGAPDIAPRQMREYLIRLIYCEMLGVECSWGYIHAVKLTQSAHPLDKRIGYLGCSLFLHENHELNMLLVNTLQKDLKSSNMLEVSMALIIICKLMGAEMIPPLLPLVQDKLLHPKELVRKKAIMVMCHFHFLSPGTVSHLEDDFRRALSDQDPGVMEAALVLFQDLVKADPVRYKDLAVSFTNILTQVVTRKLPADFDYHGVPAPWIQIKLLRILAVLGADDLKTSELIYTAIEDVLGSAECTSNIGQAITYECIRTVASIYPNNGLIERAAKAVVRFVGASNNNWRYLGINALASLVQIDPKYAAEHQMVVIDCLDDPDDTLKRKTLDLLFKMTNPLNVTVITERLIGYLRQTRDEYIRSDLVAKITQLAERFAPDNQWFIQTMNSVFELGGTLVRREVAHNLMRLIAEGTEDEETDAELRLDAVSSYISLLEKPHLPDVLVKIICWVVGEYAYTVEDENLEEILDKVTALLSRRFEETDTIGWIITTVTKLVSQLGYMPEGVQSHIALYLTSTNTDLQQRCSELAELVQTPTLMQAVLPLDASCEDLEVDSSLSFLDDFVSEALAGGSTAYRPPHLRSPAELKKAVQSPGIKFEPYAPPSPAATYNSRTTPTPSNTSPSLPRDTPTFSIKGEPPFAAGSAPAGSSSPVPIPASETRHASVRDYSYNSPREGSAAAGLAVKTRVWGRDGYKKTVEPEAPPITTPTAPPTVEPPTQQEEAWLTSGGGGVELVATAPVEANTALSSAQASILSATPEDTKRKELASQLFGSLTGPSRAPRSRQQKRAASSSEQATSAAARGLPLPAGIPLVGGGGGAKSAGGRKAKEPEVDLLLDLQDIDFSSHQPLVHSAPPPSSSGSGRAAPGQPPPAEHSVFAPPMAIPSATTSNGSADLLGLFDGSLSDSNASPLPPSSSSPFTVPSSGATLTPQQQGALGEISTLAPSLSEGAAALTLFESPVGSIRVPQEYSSFPVADGWQNKELCHDTTLRVSLTKVLKPDQLVLIFFLTNQKQAEVGGVTLSMEPPTCLRAMTSGGNEDLTIQTNIGGFGSVTHVVTMVPVSPAINMSLKGQVAYKHSLSGARRLFFDVTVYITDVIRPVKITTPEFGQKWGALAYEKRLKLSSSAVKKPAQLMEILKTKFNLYPVEVIGTEGIASGTFLPSIECLVHGKLGGSSGGGGGLDFWVRSPSSLLTESIAKLAQTFVK